MEGIVDAFQGGMSIGARAAEAAENRKTMQMKMDLQGQQMAAALQDRRMRTDIQQQRADTYAARAGMGGPTDDSATIAALPGDLDLPALPTAGGGGGGGGGGAVPRRRTGGGADDPLTDVAQNFRLLMAGGQAQQNVAKLSALLEASKAASDSSVSPDQPALQAQTAAISDGLQKARMLDMAVKLTGSQRLAGQLSRLKDGSIDTTAMTDVQRQMAQQLGLPAGTPQPAAPAPKPGFMASMFGADVPDPTPDQVAATGAATDSFMKSAGLPPASAPPAAFAPSTGGGLPAPVPPPAAPAGGDPSDLGNAMATFQAGRRRTIAPGTPVVSNKDGVRLMLQGGQWVPAP